MKQRRNQDSQFVRHVEVGELQRVIDLGKVPPSKLGWGRPKIVVALWMIIDALFVANSLQPSSAVRRFWLRRFGAEIGKNVILRPGLKIRFPWNFSVGDRSWLGEGVWISNREKVIVGHDVVISQGTFITTGSHHHRTDMRVIASPVTIEPGAWVTVRCIVLGGVNIGRSALVAPGTVVNSDVPENTIYQGSPMKYMGKRLGSPEQDIS